MARFIANMRPKGEAGLPGLRELIRKIKAVQPGVPVKGFGPKARHQAAWEYGKWLKKSLVKKLLDCSKNSYRGRGASRQRTHD